MLGMCRSLYNSNGIPEPSSRPRELTSWAQPQKRQLITAGRRTQISPMLNAIVSCASNKFYGYALTLLLHSTLWLYKVPSAHL